MLEITKQMTNNKIKKAYYRGELLYTSVNRHHLNFLKNIRNKQMDVLRQSKPLKNYDQRRWFRRVIKKADGNSKPENVHFMIYILGCPDKIILIGYCGLCHIDYKAKTAEISFLLAPEYENNDNFKEGVFDNYMEFMVDVIAPTLKLDRLWSECYEHREFMLKLLDKHLVCEGVKRKHVYRNNRIMDSVFHGVLIPKLKINRKTIV